MAELKKNNNLEIRRGSGSSGSSEGEENDNKSDATIARALMSLMSPRSTDSESTKDLLFQGVHSPRSPSVDRVLRSSSPRRRLSGIKRSVRDEHFIHPSSSTTAEVIRPSPRSRRRSVAGAVPGTRS